MNVADVIADFIENHGATGLKLQGVCECDTLDLMMCEGEMSPDCVVMYADGQ